jgi:hypothetical protein
VSETFWFGWLAVFLVFELVMALDGKKGGTLSETVGDWVGVKKWARSTRRFSLLRRTVLFFFLVSLSLHLVWGFTVFPVMIFGSFLAAIIIVGLKEK